MEAEIEARVAAEFPDASINVSLDGNRALIEVVSVRFLEMTRVKKQQSVYACIAEYISDGRLHAVTIKTDTPPEA